MKEENGLQEVVNYLISKTFMSSVLVAVIMFALLYIIKQYLIKKVAYTGKNEQHKNTFIGVVFNILQYIVVVVAIVIILHLHGVNVTSILAGIGIAATIIGLALQDTLKDILAGINIYNNNFYKVGDVVRYNGEECDVKYFNARVTKFESIATGSTYTVCNSTINSIEKIKDSKGISLTFDFNVDRNKVEEICNAAIERAKDECKRIRSAGFSGIVDITREGVTYYVYFNCAAHKKGEARKAMLVNLYDEFKSSGITPVFNRAFRQD